MLAQWRAQIKRAVYLGSEQSAVQQRLSLKKMIVKLPEAMREWSTEKSKARPVAPAVCDHGRAGFGEEELRATAR